MAGRVSNYNTTMMTKPALLRASGGDALTCAAADAVFNAADGYGVIDRRALVSDPSSHPPMRAGGVMFAADGLLRVIAVPAGATLPNLAVYARFLDGNAALEEVSVRLAESEPPAGATKATHGAAVLEMRAPPGDCRLTVLADKDAVIFYSHTV